MTILATFILSPNESKVYTIGYTDWLGATEVIDLVVATPSDPALNVDAQISADDKEVAITVGPGGVDGDEIDVVIVITTDAPQIKEDCIVFQIEDVCS